MNKLKEKFGKYFQFKNTINGTAYMLRGLAAVLFAIPMGIFLGIGMVSLPTSAVLGGFLILLGCAFIVPLVWLSLSTGYKRINAFFPGKAGWLLALTFFYSMVLEGFNPQNVMNVLDTPAGTLPNGDYITYVILALPYWAWSLYLVFGNSPIAKNEHIG